MSTLRILCCPLAVVVLGTGFFSQRGLSQNRPNIILIYADDHSEAALSCYGSRINSTPNIDALARQGMRFSNSFVGNSICGPARATILTGLHSHANGKLDNRSGFRNELPTFAKLLKEQGYATSIVGKWHIRSNPMGFDHWSIIGGGYYNPMFRTAAGRQQETGYATDLITKKSLDWIRKQKQRGRPFMAWISYTAAHRTWMPATRHLKRYSEKKIAEPTTLFDDYSNRNPGAASAQMRISKDLFPAYDLKLPVTGKGFLDQSMAGKLKRMTREQRTAWQAAYGPENAAFKKAAPAGRDLVRWKYQRYIKDYLRCVDAIDESVGKIQAFLKSESLEKNTVVIYTSDQGFFLGEHGWYDKRWMYEPALRTPLIVKWPGKTEPGSISKKLVQNIDLAPTILQLAEVDHKVDMHGKSLTPLLQSKDAKWRDAIYYHYHMQEPEGRASHLVARHYGIRTERYKLMRVYDHDTWEFYDLQSDPDEMQNRIQQPEQQQQIRTLKKRLAELRKHFGDQEGPAVENN